MSFTVDLFAFGGTIAMAGAAGEGARPALDGAALAAELNLPGDVTLRSETLRNTGSANLTAEDIAGLVRRVAASDADAFIVTQGTDTMEETSFLARLLYNGPRPIVFTGAMRPASHPGADGPANLAAALAVACSPQAPHVSVMMNGLLHDPALVRKGHTSQLEAFISDGGPIGAVVEGALQRFKAAADLPVFHWPKGQALPMVGHVTALFDQPVDVLNAYSSQSGLVVAALGGGHVSEVWSDRLAELVETMPVLLASRCGEGPVLTGTYGYKGAEVDLISRGLEPTGVLGGRKARLALSALLIENRDNWRHHLRGIRAAVQSPLSGPL